MGGGGWAGKGGGAYNRTKKSVSKQALSLFSWSINQNVNVRDTQMTMRMTGDARQERHEKRETTRKARENGLSRPSDFLGMKTEVLS